MDHERTNEYGLSSGPLPGPGGPQGPSHAPVYAGPPYPPGPPERRRLSGWRILWGALFGLSVLANIGLFVILFGMVALLAAGQTRFYEEAIIREGPANNKIVVVNVDGIIYDQLADNVYRQLKAARQDRNVKGLIVRVNSPGGTISASDQIYQQIRKYRAEENEPILAFMQGVAASGGYYTSVACDEIMAEPTALTGSIGVIMSHFVFAELLENKLGIVPIHLTMGEKKDWPSSFRVPEQEELDYLQERLLTPAYERFVKVVEQGRDDALSSSEVRTLADGSVYVAAQALEVKLIDKIGYLDDAIEAIKALTGLTSARVVEYRRPFSWISFLNARTQKAFSLDRATLYKLSSPEILYLWSAGVH